MRWSQTVVDQYFADGGDEHFRLDHYDDPKYIYEIGAHCGEFTEKLAARFPEARIMAFEPAPTYYAMARDRLKDNQNVSVLPYGFWSEEFEGMFIEDGAASHVDAEGTVNVWMMDAAALSSWRIDLLILNVEGAEYSILPRLIETGVDRIKDLQIQFHDTLSDASVRMWEIQEKLKITHQLTYQYPFCMENWRRR